MVINAPEWQIVINDVINGSNTSKWENITMVINENVTNHVETL